MGSKSDWSINYKIDVIDALAAKGYNYARLRREKLIGGATISRLRHRQSVSWDIIAQLCELLECDIQDILECRDGDGNLATPNPDLFTQFPPHDLFELS